MLDHRYAVPKHIERYRSVHSRPRHILDAPEPAWPTAQRFNQSRTESWPTAAPGKPAPLEIDDFPPPPPSHSKDICRGKKTGKWKAVRIVNLQMPAVNVLVSGRGIGFINPAASHNGRMFPNFEVRFEQPVLQFVALTFFSARAQTLEQAQRADALSPYFPIVPAGDVWPLSRLAQVRRIQTSQSSCACGSKFGQLEWVVS